MAIKTAYFKPDASSDVMGKVEDLADGAQAKARDMTENAVREISSIVASLKTQLRELGVDTEKMIDGAKDSAVSVEKRIAEEIVARPVRSLAIAAGVGLLLGFVTRK